MPSRAAATQPAGPFVYDVKNDLWWWSPEMYAIHGLDQGGAQPATGLLAARIHADDRAAVLEQLERVLAEGGPFSWSYRARDAAERERSVVCVGEGVAEADQVVRVQGYVVDVTEPFREATTAAVRASAAHRAAIEQVKGALMVSYGVSEDVAFSLLRGYSNRHNLRLSILAEHVADRLASPRYQQLEPRLTLMTVLAEVTGERNGAEAG